MGDGQVKRYKLPEQDDPVLPQEVATKNYVDSSAAAVFTVFSNIINQGNATQRYSNLLGSNVATEGNIQNAAPRAMTGKKLTLRIVDNNATAALTFVLRVNGVDTALSISIGAGVTGVLDVTADVAIAQDDLLSYGVGPKTGGTNVGILASLQLQ